MSVTAKCLIQSKYAANSATTEYTTPDNTRTIIDKFTATNHDAGAQTISVHLIPFGGATSDNNLIVKAKSMNAGETLELTDLKNHILNAGDIISVFGSTANKITIRASGREVVS